MSLSRYVSVSLPNPDGVVRVLGDPREYWGSEVTGLVPWLAGVLPELSVCLGLGLERVVSRERGIGEGLRADLLVGDVAGRLVLVEAQLGRSDHDHLGKLLAYQALTNAEVVVWVVADTDFHAPPIRYEHRLALARLRQSWAGQIEVHAVEATIEATWKRSEGLDFGAAVLTPHLRRVNLDRPDLRCPIGESVAALALPATAVPHSL